METSLDEIRAATLRYMAARRRTAGGRFAGYTYAESTDPPVLYATVAALLLKQLYRYNSGETEEELDFLTQFQCADGLFRDPVISCPEADTEEWWGWRHLTALALMTLGLYGIPARKRLAPLAEKLGTAKEFATYLASLNWEERVDFTSNELQNVGVALQYARDCQECAAAGRHIELLFEYLDRHQDENTGIFGAPIRTSLERSRGVQAGYHFWLLYDYDKRPINFAELIIDSILATQNILGGFSVSRDSSACEDIDSIDPLVRLAGRTNHRQREVQACLRTALAAVLRNVNADGGWVFRRHQPFTYGYSPHMHSRADESNLFFSWFRTLGLAYCLEGLEELPPRWRYEWNWGFAPGYQFLQRTSAAADC